MSRRSEWIAYLAIGGAYLAMLTTCDNKDDPALQVPPRVAVFPDVQSCLEDGTNGRFTCTRALEAATKAHVERAPHFANHDTCENAHGAQGCQVVSPPAGPDYFVPVMAGFVLGNALGLDRAVPVYYDSQGYARVAGGDYVLGRRCRDGEKDNCSGNGGGDGGGSGGSGGNTHVTKGKEWVNTASTNMRTVSRGGFGQAVHGVGS